MDDLIQLYDKIKTANPYVGEMWATGDEFASTFNKASADEKKDIYNTWVHGVADAPTFDEVLISSKKKSSSGPPSLGSPVSFASPSPLPSGVKNTPKAPGLGNTSSLFSTGDKVPATPPSVGVGFVPPAEVPVNNNPTPTDNIRTSFAEGGTQPYLGDPFLTLDSYTVSDGPMLGPDGTPQQYTAPSPEDLGEVFLLGQTVSFDDKPIKYRNSDGEEVTTTILNREVYKDYLIGSGLTEEAAERKLIDIQNSAVSRQVKKEKSDIIYELYTNAVGGGSKDPAKDANRKYLAEMNNKGMKLLTSDEAMFYIMDQPRLNTLNTKLGKGTLTDAENAELEELRLKQQRVVGGSGMLFDPTTGQLLKGSKVTEAVTNFNTYVLPELKAKYANTSKAKLTEGRDDLILEIEVLEKRLFPDSQQDQISEGVLDAIKSTPGFDHLVPLVDRLTQARGELYAINRALFFNVDPASAVQNDTILRSPGLANVVHGLTGSKSAKDVLSEYINVAKKQGVEVTPEQEEAATRTLSDDVYQAVGATIPAMVQLLLAKSFVTDPITASRIGRGVSSALSGALGNRLGMFVYGLAEGALTYGVAGQGVGTGVGETAAQGTFDILGLDKVLTGKLGPVSGKLVEYLGRVTAGIVGETAEEFAGQYIQALTDTGFDWQKAADQAFGSTEDDFTKQLAVIVSMSAMMSGAFNLPVLLKTRKSLESQPDSPLKADTLKDLNRQIDEMEKQQNEKNKTKTEGTQTQTVLNQDPETTTTNQPIQQDGSQTPDFMIGGEVAASRDPKLEEALNKAKTLEEEGVSPQEIYSRTGWEKNDVGDWEFDVFSLIENPVQITDSSQVELIPSKLMSGKMSLRNKATGDEFLFSVEEGTSLDEAISRFNELREERSTGITINDRKYQGVQDALRERGTTGIVSEDGDSIASPNVVSVNRLLFSIFPELKEVKLQFKFMPNADWAAAYSHDNKTIYVNTDAIDSVELRSALSHEIQHAIQRIENHPVGIDFEHAQQMVEDLGLNVDADSVYMNTPGEVQARVSASRSSLNPKDRKMISLSESRDIVGHADPKLEVRDSVLDLQSNTKELKPEVSEKVTKLVDRIRKVFPSVGFTTFDSFDQVLGQDSEGKDFTVRSLFEKKGGTTLETYKGMVYGFRYNGNIYVNANVLNSEVPIHEFGHIWVDMLKAVNLKQYKEAITLLQKENPELIKTIKANPLYKSMTESEILNEALVTAIGQYGSKKYESEYSKGFWDKVKDIFETIMNALGLGSPDPLTPFNKVLDDAYKRITGSQPLLNITPSKNTKSDFMAQFTGKNPTDDQEVKDVYDTFIGRTSGAKEQDGVLHLIEEGYSIPRIRQALGTVIFDKYVSEVVDKDFETTWKKYQDKIMSRRSDIVDKVRVSTDSIDVIIPTLLAEGYSNFEIYNALIDSGFDNDSLVEAFGPQYHKTIQDMLNAKKLPEELLASIGDDARAIRISRGFDELNQTFEDMPVGDAEIIIGHIGSELEGGTATEAFAVLTNYLRSVLRGNNTEDITQRDADNIMKVTDFASHLGRMLAMMKGLAGNQNQSLEKAIIKNIESSGGIITAAQRETLTKLVNESVVANEKYKETKRKLDEGLKEGVLEDGIFDEVSNAEIAMHKANTNLNAFVGKWNDPQGLEAITERLMAASAKAMLSFRSSAIGGLDNSFNWLISRGLHDYGAIRSVQRATDTIFAMMFPRQGRTMVASIKGRGETAITGHPSFSHKGMRVEIKVEDSRNYIPGTVVQTTDGHMGKVTYSGRDVVKLAPLDGVPFTTDSFRQGTTISRVINTKGQYRQLAVWAKKEALKRANIQVKSVLQKGYPPSDKVQRQYLEATMGASPFEEVGIGYKLLTGLITNRYGKNIWAMTPEERADAIGTVVRKAEEGTLDKVGVIGSQLISSLSALALEAPSEFAIRAIALSGDRQSFNMVLYNTLLQKALSEGLVEPAAIKRYILVNSSQQFDQDSAVAKIASRQIFANSNMVAKFIIGWRTTSKRKAREAGQEFRNRKQLHINIISAALKRIGWNLSSLSSFLLSPFTTVPTNQVVQAIRKTEPNFSTIMLSWDIGKFLILYHEYQRRFPLGAKRTDAQEKEMKQLEDDLFYSRRMINEGVTSLAIAVLLQTLYAAMISSGSVTPPAGSDRDRDKLLKSLGLRPGELNLTHFREVIQGNRKPTDKWKSGTKGDVVLNFPNLGIFGFGLAYQSALDELRRSFDSSKQHVSSSLTADYSAALRFSAFSNAAASISLLTNWSNLADVMTGEQDADKRNRFEPLIAAQGKILAGSLFPNILSFMGRGEGTAPMTTTSYFQDVNQGPSNIFMTVWTALSPRIPVPSWRAPLYQSKVGPFGEDLKSQTGFFEPGTAGAYLQNMFDPSGIGNYRENVYDKAYANLLLIKRLSEDFYADRSPVLRMFVGGDKNQFFVTGSDDTKFQVAMPIELYQQYMRDLGKARVNNGALEILNNNEHLIYSHDTNLTPSQEAEVNASIRRFYTDLTSALNSAEEEVNYIYVQKVADHWNDLIAKGKVSTETIQELHRKDPERYPTVK